MVETPVQPVFSTESAAHELPADRPVRISGFVALGLGMLSGFTILTTAFLPLPVITLIVAGFALRPARRGVPVGRSAAYAGAVLAVFFGSWGWLHAATREAALQQHASRFAQYWLETLQQGDTELALELASPPSTRQSEKMSLKTYYEQNETARENLQEFLERSLVSTVIAGGESLRWETAEPPAVIQRKDGDEVIVRLIETTGMVGGVVQIDLMRITYRSAEPVSGEWTVIDFHHHEN